LKLEISQKTLFQQSPNPSFRSTINQKIKIPQPVRKPNQLNNVPKKPSTLKTACEKPTTEGPRNISER
jgi:hypothetical protein